MCLTSPHIRAPGEDRSTVKEEMGQKITGRSRQEKRLTMMPLVWSMRNWEEASPRLQYQRITSTTEAGWPGHDPRLHSSSEVLTNQLPHSTANVTWSRLRSVYFELSPPSCLRCRIEQFADAAGRARGLSRHATLLHRPAIRDPSCPTLP